MGILQSKECSVLLWKGVHEPLMQACTNLKSLKEICILSHAIMVLYGSMSFWAIVCVRCFRKCWHWFPISLFVFYPISYGYAILHCSFFGWRCIILNAVFKVYVVLVPNNEKQRLLGMMFIPFQSFRGSLPLCKLQNTSSNRVSSDI